MRRLNSPIVGTLRTLKELGKTDAYCAEALGISVSTIQLVKRAGYDHDSYHAIIKSRRIVRKQKRLAESMKSPFFPTVMYKELVSRLHRPSKFQR